jgi:serine/threonine protein kinase
MLEAIQRIGKGSSCQVYTVLNKSDNKLYAIKESSSKENEDIIKNEVSVFKILNNESPYIVHFYDFFEGKNEKNKPCLCIQIEYCEYGSIREILKKAKKKNIKISELEISAIIYHVLQGIDFIHKKKLVNRDIKGRNILVGKNGSVKLCDFGICKKYIKNGMKKYRGGSPYWMAPEILKKEEYFQNIDIWALGITCIELAEYEPPYSKYSPEEVLKKIIKNPPKGLAQPEMWSYEFNDFVKKCLELDKNKRPSAEELLKHDFIVNLDKKNLNKNLIIYKFLIKCGYKVLYNKKERIPKNLCLNKINNLNIFDINNIYNSNDKKNAFYKKINNNNMLLDEGLRLKLKFNETNINSFSNRKKNSNDINMIYINDKNQRELSPLVVNRQQIRKSVQYRNNKIKSVNKKIYIRPQSLEKVNINTNSTEENDKNIIKNENKINYIPYKTSNSNINNMNNTNSKENKESKKNKNYNFKKNNVIYLNITNYRNINPINPIMVNTNNTEGSEKKYEPILSEENDFNDINDFNLDEKILDTKIKSLEKERDFMLKNIINKYQDKIAKINQEKNNLMMKYSLKNNSINNNIKMKKGSINSIDNFVNNIVNNLKNKYDYSASTTTSNK